jgi:hypothetical protein
MFVTNSLEFLKQVASLKLSPQSSQRDLAPFVSQLRLTGTATATTTLVQDWNSWMTEAIFDFQMCKFSPLKTSRIDTTAESGLISTSHPCIICVGQ